MFKQIFSCVVLAFLVAGCFNAEPDFVDPTPKKEKKSEAKIDEINNKMAYNTIYTLTPMCQAKNSGACNDLGVAYEFVKDYKNALISYKMACDLGLEQGCAGVGMLYEKGLGVAKNGQRAIEIYKSSCNKSDALSCYYLANAYRKGEIVMQDYKAAMDAYVNACRLEDVPSCANIGAMYEEGLGVDKDELRAYEIYKVACFRGFNKSCPHMKRLGKKLGVN